MKAYRIYIVGSDGRLQLGQAFEAVDDAAAAGHAERLATPGSVAEVWEGGRMVGMGTLTELRDQAGLHAGSLEDIFLALTDDGPRRPPPVASPR